VPRPDIFRTKRKGVLLATRRGTLGAGPNTPRTVEDARLECRLILHGTPEGAQLANAKRLMRDAKAPGAASDDAAKKIIDVIKTNGFCQAAA
jgi:hypothetical protein